MLSGSRAGRHVSAVVPGIYRDLFAAIAATAGSLTGHAPGPDGTPSPEGPGLAYVTLS